MLHAVMGADGWCLVFDPIPLCESERSRSVPDDLVSAIVLTNGHHERAAGAPRLSCVRTGTDAVELRRGLEALTGDRIGGLV